jgi:hypothetical protein
MRMPGRGMYAVVLADSEFLAVGEGTGEGKRRASGVTLGAFCFLGYSRRC